MKMTWDTPELREPMESLSSEQFSLGYRLSMLLDRMKDYRNKTQNFKYPAWMIGRLEFDNDMKYVVDGYELIMGNHIEEMDVDTKQTMNVLWKKYQC